MASPNNPHDICTWRPVSECAGCSIAGRLKCRFKLGDLPCFLGMFFDLCRSGFCRSHPGRLWMVSVNATSVGGERISGRKGGVMVAIAWINFAVLVVSALLFAISCVESARPAALERRIGEAACHRCAQDRSVAAVLMFVASANYVIHAFFPLPVGCRARFPGRGGFRQWWQF